MTQVAYCRANFTLKVKPNYVRYFTVHVTLCVSPKQSVTVFERILEKTRWVKRHTIFNYTPSRCFQGYNLHPQTTVLCTFNCMRCTVVFLLPNTFLNLLSPTPSPLGPLLPGPSN